MTAVARAIPRNNAQNKSRLLGKILRINVNGTGHGPFDHYSVPRSNPFYGSTPGLEAIWDYGLRNPWRISFDRGTGKLFIADVGQGRREEVNREKAGFTGGRNYGWDAMEGMLCYTASKCPLAGDTLPNAEYSHDGGNCSITGGYVYRGPTQTALVGLYVFADWCSGRIWTIPHNGAGGEHARDVARRHGPQHHVVRRKRERRAVRGHVGRGCLPGARLVAEAGRASGSGAR